MMASRFSASHLPHALNEDGEAKSEGAIQMVSPLPRGSYTFRRSRFRKAARGVGRGTGSFFSP